MIDLKNEWPRARSAFLSVDKQAAFVLLATALLVILQMQFGDRGFFRTTIAPALDLEGRGLHSWVWWFGMQGVLGFIVPVVLLKAGFKLSWKEMGLGVGDAKFASKVALLYVPLVIVGTWFLSDSNLFQAKYPHFSPAGTDWSVFLIYESFFLLYWIGWEYLWRGFVLFGTARSFGVMAIFIQAMPFAIMHFDKPLIEALLSIVGGVALGALVWRAKSFWIAVPIHAAQMIILDFWCSMRIRTGATGIGVEALMDALKGF